MKRKNHQVYIMSKNYEEYDMLQFKLKNRKKRVKKKS